MTIRHLTLENFKVAYLEPKIPALHTIPGAPPAYLFVDDLAKRIGLRVQTDELRSLPPSPLVEVTLTTLLVDNRLYLEVSTAAQQLYGEFFYLALSIADLVQIQGRKPLDAVRDSFDTWQELLKKVETLDEDAEIGLLGELWLLKRLISTIGTTALYSWTGPAGAPQDFHVGTNDFEVKSTMNRRRTHIVNGLKQLTPNRGRNLYILSLQFESAGTNAGYSLPDVIGEIRNLLSHDEAALTRFNSIIEEGFSILDEDSKHYTSRYRLRAKPALIPVNDLCPKITEDILCRAIPADLLRRVSDVHYRIDVEGLGVSDGSPEFIAILPSAFQS